MRGWFARKWRRWKWTCASPMFQSVAFSIAQDLMSPSSPTRWDVSGLAVCRVLHATYPYRVVFTLFCFIWPDRRNFPVLDVMGWGVAWGGGEPGMVQPVSFSFYVFLCALPSFNEKDFTLFWAGVSFVCTMRSVFAALGSISVFFPIYIVGNWPRLPYPSPVSTLDLARCSLEICCCA